MTVADLQQHLGDLARLLSSTDAKKSAAEFRQVAEGLDPFKAFSIADFASFLPHAETYHRTGVIPVGKGSKLPKPPKPPAEGNPEFAALHAEVVRIYKAGDMASVTSESIEDLRPRLKKLKKSELLDLAQSVELVGMANKTIPAILDSIVNRLRSIKQSSVRTSIIDRPGTQY